MSSYFHTPYQNSVTEFKEDHMNSPLGEIDYALYEVSGEIQTGVHDFHDKTAVTTSVESDDELVLYDASAFVYKRITQANYGGSAKPYDIGIMKADKPSASEVLLRYPVPRTVYFDYDCSPGQAIADVAATAETVFNVKKDGATFCTITFAISGTTGTFSGEDRTFVTGEILTLEAPASADATLADLAFSICGVRL